MENTSTTTTTAEHVEPSIDILVEKYMSSLSPKETKSLVIAKEHLGMSFSIEKSVGFIQWLKEQK